MLLLVLVLIVKEFHHLNVSAQSDRVDDEAAYSSWSSAHEVAFEAMLLVHSIQYLSGARFQVHVRLNLTFDDVERHHHGPTERSRNAARYQIDEPLALRAQYFQLASNELEHIEVDTIGDGIAIDERVEASG